jgi:hypothetical protein
MPIDKLIDELLRLQARYPALIWRLRQEEGIAIEFYLEEMALDCTNALKKAGLPADHLTDRPRQVWLPETMQLMEHQDHLLTALEIFLEKHNNPIFYRSIKNESDL